MARPPVPNPDFPDPDFPSRRSLLRGSLAAALLGAAGRRRAAAQPAPRSSGPPDGALLLIGGGTIVPEIQQAAVRLGCGAGGTPGRWVYIPTAVADDELHRTTPPGFTTSAGASVTVLHTRNPRIADSETFVAPLREATAVFFQGGRQWRLVDAYGDTRTERELRAVLERGGLIAGTSAGATIQGSYLVRGAPAGNHIMMSPGHERGFGYLTNVAVDQHVVAAGRTRDLAAVVAAHPGLLGIGIDEATAAIVERNRLTVIGRSVVLITDGAPHDGEPYYVLKPGMQFDLASWTVLPAP
jgi:cyanophycinase